MLVPFTQFCIASFLARHLQCLAKKDAMMTMMMPFCLYNQQHRHLVSFGSYGIGSVVTFACF